MTKRLQELPAKFWTDYTASLKDSKNRLAFENFAKTPTKHCVWDAYQLKICKPLTDKIVYYSNGQFKDRAINKLSNKDITSIKNTLKEIPNQMQTRKSASI